MAKGNSTEAAVLGAFEGRGLAVLVPFGGGHPYDLVVDLGDGVFLRVQCKTARRKDGCVMFNGRGTDHGRGRTTYRGRADIIAAYCPPTDTVYLVPVSDRFSPRLRLRPARNNQRRGVQLAADYEIGRWSRRALIGIVQDGRAGAERVAAFA